MKKFLPLIFLLVLFPNIAQAHCPLCTAGAGALAVAAAYLGVSTVVVGVFIGAFSLALGMWITRLIKKKHFAGQDGVLIAVIFLTTVIPIMPLIREYRPLYVSLQGEYGSLLHNTYTINLYLLGVVVGALILWISPYVSKKITTSRGGGTLPYQGLTITFLLLVAISLVLQITI